MASMKEIGQSSFDTNPVGLQDRFISSVKLSIIVVHGFVMADLKVNWYQNLTDVIVYLIIILSRIMKLVLR